LNLGGGLNLAYVSQKLLCFGANGVGTLKGTKIGVHWMAHRYNLAFKTLSTLGIVSNIEVCYKVVMHILLIAQIGPLSSLNLLI
jgi:hypothetical protein